MVIILIIILFILLIIYYIYRYFRDSARDIESEYSLNEYFFMLNLAENNNETVVLLKTHIWNDEIEKFANKIRNETKNIGVDFYILMHDNSKSEIIKKVKNDDLRSRTLVFSEDEIKNLYTKGFYNMWLSNHWILMWFYRKSGGKYKYYWSVEYDVRIIGDSSIIFGYKGTEDFVYPIKPIQDPNWYWKSYYIGGKLTDKDKYYGYLQLARYSKRFLDYLDTCYRAGENGQDELITYSLFKRGKFTGTHNFLSKFIGFWYWDVKPGNFEKYKKLWETESTEDRNFVRIFHPVKT
ncbi:MAG: hypothetical protein QXW79_01645 [Thermoplasmata archaeon]